MIFLKLADINKLLIFSEAPKPFVNISFMQYSTAHSTLLQVIFCSILIQEFHVRTDMGFVNAILRLFDTKKGKSSIERLVSPNKLLLSEISAHCIKNSLRCYKYMYNRKKASRKMLKLQV